MAAINDLISKIADADLRQRIEAELGRLLKQKQFGLVFEDHLPEGLDEGPVYPALEMLDEVRHAGEGGVWHALIEADNYYALQLLAYLYPGQVDCIYIDPPYNTGARDWKYNNDYVDTADQYRHSKWLSMMKRRLLLAKKLLNPRDSVLIVTIDEKEYLHLGCLLEDLFPEARMQMVSSVINNGGSMRSKEFTRVDEYLFFVMLGECGPDQLPLEKEWLGNVKHTTTEKLRWRELMRYGDNGKRSARPNLFYPVFVSKEGDRFMGVGQPLPFDKNINDIDTPDGAVAVWPIRPNGEEGTWGYDGAGLLKLQKKGYVKLGRFNKNSMAITFIQPGWQKKVESGEIQVVGYALDGSIIESNEGYVAKYSPKTQWAISTHSASEYGTKLIQNIIGKRFSFPKSLYAVHDAIRFFVDNKPDALIVDFFAGSGTTLHAVNLLNAEDGGRRRCIMVTNNEVSEQEAKELAKQGYKPGDEEWEGLGIARYVAWPRTVCSIEGHDVNGEPLKGEYLGTDHRQMSEGFESNCVFFKLNFLDKTKVALGRQFKELVPLLWMKAGAVGRCPRLESDVVPQMLVLPENGFAVLTDEKAFGEFVERVNACVEVGMVYLVVDSDSMYREMAKQFPQRQTCQLYRDYLDNFRINVTR